MTRILIIDDEPLIRDTLAEFLESEGFRTTACASGEDGLLAIQKDSYAIVLCDLHLPGVDGLEVLTRAMRLSPHSAVLLVTAYATIETAIEAFQLGAADYLMKPIVLRDVALKVRRILKQQQLLQENLWLRRALNQSTDPAEMVVGRCPLMLDAMRIATKVAQTRSTVLILGQSGTGKELMARNIHQQSELSTQPDSRFLPINCAAISADQLERQLFGYHASRSPTDSQPGLFSFAGNGSVFLDEIGELPLPIQAQLLRVIERKEVLPVGANAPEPIGARIIAATNKDLPKEVQAGRFREDLYHRLNVIAIALPTLCDRRGDIPELADALMRKHAHSIGKPFRGIDQYAMKQLMNYPWRGNIRELENAIQRAMILGDGPLVQLADLPAAVQCGTTELSEEDRLNDALARFEKHHIERVLKLVGDKREAANRLGIGVSSLYRKIEQLGIIGPS